MFGKAVRPLARPNFFPERGSRLKTGPRQILWGVLLLLLGLSAFFGSIYLAALGVATVLITLGASKTLGAVVGLLIGFVLGPALIVGVLMLTSSIRRRLGRRPWLQLRSALGLGHGVMELARRLDMDATTLRQFKPQYRKCLIPKRNGGTRALLIPDVPTKDLQRRILWRLLARLKAHPAAHAYERGLSVATNAAQHSRQQVVLKMDLKDFFGRTSAGRVETYFRRIGWNKEAAALLTRFVTTNGGLPQGAPTSPRLANLVNISLDRNIARVAARTKGTYTRYADDITISFPEDWPRKLREVVHAVRRIARGCGYQVHGGRKLGIYRQHQRQRVCGVVVNAKLSLPREVRRRLRAIEHTLKTGKVANMSASQLAGWRAYEKSLAQVATPTRTLRPRKGGTYRHVDEPVASASKPGQAPAAR